MGLPEDLVGRGIAVAAARLGPGHRIGHIGKIRRASRRGILLAVRRGAARLALGTAAALGVVFLVIKGAEYAAKATAGIGWDTHPFFTFYYLLTGFHAAHVLAGVVVLLLVAWQDSPRNIEAGAAFWHMVDLVWVLLFPVLYLLR
ncbi:MAG: cytochrome c oxidase subunit 3 [Roseovarius sp.]